MDEEIKEKIEKTYELSIENNRILRRIRRSNILGLIFKIIVFVVVTGVGTWFYVYILHPYLQQMIETYNSVQGGVENIGSEVDSNLKKLLEMLKFGSGK